MNSNFIASFCPANTLFLSFILSNEDIILHEKIIEELAKPNNPDIFPGHTLQLNDENYPISILTNLRRDKLFFHSTTRLHLASEEYNWFLYPGQLLEIMKLQNIVPHVPNVPKLGKVKS